MCEIKITYDNPKNLEFWVELPLDDEKSISLLEQDLKILELQDKIMKGMYSEFYLIKNNVLFKHVVDNSQGFTARVIPDSLIDVVLHLGLSQSGHNGYQRTYAAIKNLYLWKGWRMQILKYCKGCKVCALQKAKNTNLKNYF